MLSGWGDDLAFDAVLCDPPYGLKFMGKAWDHGVPSADTWEIVSSVLKPGAPLLAFGGTRTFHRLTCTIEDAGFEIRDCLAWLYGQGFPKSHNLKGAFQGYGTALKPAWEPCILAMKPTAGTFAENALAHGVAGLNVDGCRIAGPKGVPASLSNAGALGWGTGGDMSRKETQNGRWPANVMLDEDAAAMLDEQSGERGGGFGTENRVEGSGRYGKFSGATKGRVVGFGDSGGASRFFYVAKASRSEREAGLGGFGDHDSSVGDRRPSGNMNQRIHGVENRRDIKARNHHPTVKPLAVCEWLARLILPPKRDTPRRLLVPFSGSGSEMIGALRAGWEEVWGIEIDPEYCRIAEARLAHWAKKSNRASEAVK